MVLYIIWLHFMSFHCIYGMAWHGIVLYLNLLYSIAYYLMVSYGIALYSFSLQGIEYHLIILYGIACHCIVFDFIALYCMLFHWIVCYYIVLYFIRFHCMVLYCIRFFCTVSHCHVPLLQRAGELPRSASSHFDRILILSNEADIDWLHLGLWAVYGLYWYNVIWQITFTANRNYLDTRSWFWNIILQKYVNAVPFHFDCCSSYNIFVM